jgi:ABC-type amino acid transport substrate-binding protein
MGCIGTLSALGAALTLATAGDGALVIGTEVPFPPYILQDTDGSLTGFDHDVMTEVCLRAAFACDWQLAAFDELLPGLAEGRFDVAIGGIAVTPARRERVDFTLPYQFADDLEWFIGPPGAPAPEAALTAVKAGTLHEDWLRGQGLAFQSYPTEAETIAAVAAGVTDLAFGPFEGRTDLGPLIFGAGLDLLYDARITDEGTAMALCKGNAALKSRLDAALLSMQADGTLATLESRWF